MESEPQSAIRWELICHDGDDHSWTWRSIAVDGSILRASHPFPDFGSAVGDALRHGFRPKEVHWIVKSRHSITHFHPGETPVSVSPNGQIVGRKKNRKLHSAKLAGLLAEIRRNARVVPPAGTDPVPGIMRLIAASPGSRETRTLLRVAASIADREQDFDMNDIHALSQEALGLLDALIEQTIKVSGRSPAPLLRVPAYSLSFAEQLRWRDVPEHDIMRFLRHCEGLPPEHTTPPCPLCFVAGKNAQMSGLDPPGGEQRFFCLGCRVSMTVRPMG